MKTLGILTNLHKKNTLLLVSFLLLGFLHPAVFAHKQTYRSSSKDQQETVSRRYNKYYIEAICQKALGNKSAEHDLLLRALTYCPHSPECLFELAKLKAQNPLIPIEETDSLYREALRHAPDNNQYKWEIAQYELRTGEFDKAADLLENLTQTPLFRENAFSLLASIYDQQGKDSLLLRTLDLWEREVGATESTKLARYRAYSRLKSYDKALETARDLCRTYPQNEYYPILEAEVYLSHNDSIKALAAYNNVIRTSPDNNYAQLFLVHYYTSLGKSQLAEEQAEQIILNPKQDIETRSSYLQAFVNSDRKNNNDPHSEQLFQKLLKQPMNSTELIKIYISYLIQKNAPDSAFVPAMRKMLEIDPSDKQSRLRLAWSLFQKKQYSEVVNICREGIRQDKEQILFYILGGNSAMLIKEKEQALDFFQSGMPYTSSFTEKETISDYFSAYGDLLNQMGREEESYALYDSSLVYNPSNVSTLNNYAYYLSLKKEQLEKAQRMAELAIKYSPDESTFLDTYAWVLFMRKDYDNARVYIDKAIKLLKGESSDGNIYEHAGDIYIHLGLEKEALDFWKKALDKGVHSDSLNKKIKLRKYIEQ